MSRKKAEISRKKQPVNFWESFIFKYSSRILLSLIVITIFLTLVQCTVKSPEAPTWNTTFSVPVINRLYQMDELVEKIGQDELGIDSLGNVSFSVTETIDPIGIDTAQLATADISFSQSEVLGLIDINPPVFTPLNVSLSSITGLATALPGDSAFVDSLMFSISNNFPQIQEFSSATIATGHIDISVDNYLGVSIDTLLIQLYDRQTASVVQLDTVVQSIPDSSSYLHTMNLNGRTLSNYLRVDVAAFTPGGLVQNFSARSIQTNADFGSTITVSEAVAQVPPMPDMNFSNKLGLSLNPGEQIDSAQLGSGNIIMYVTNNSSLDATVNITVPSLELGGTTYTLSQPILGGQTININTDLANYNLIPLDDTVLINLAVSLPGSGINLVPINETDSFTVSTSIGNLTFNSISGIIPDNTTNFANITQELTAPDGFNEISFVSAVLSLNIENGVDLPGNLACTLSASNGKVLEITGTIAPKGTAVRQLTTITNNDVADFLNPIPDSVTIGGSISFGDNVAHTLNVSDSIFASFDIYAPLHVKVDNAEITDIDIEREALDSSDMAQITEHVTEARFVYTITSHLPLGISAVVAMGSDSAALYTTPELVIDTFYAAAAPVDPLTGITTTEQVSEGEILLDSLDIQILQNDTLFIRPILVLNSSDTSGVLLTGSDYFSIQGRIEVEYLFDTDL